MCPVWWMCGECHEWLWGVVVCVFYVVFYEEKVCACARVCVIVSQWTNHSDITSCGVTTQHLHDNQKTDRQEGGPSANLSFSPV